MQKQTRRAPPSFWEDFADYLLGELKALGKILGLMLLAIYLFVSILVGVYHVTLYLFSLFWGLI